MYGLSASGWTAISIPSGFIFKYVPPQRLILVLLDGHASHYNPTVIREAAMSDVNLFCVPPNITHIAQPLDVTTFHSFKSHWYNVCDQYMFSHPGRKVTVQGFRRLFSQAWYEAMVPKTIMCGFRATGVYPCNK